MDLGLSVVSFGSKKKYHLTISSFDYSRGQTSDPFSSGPSLNGMPFIAKDFTTGSCASSYGGWWHDYSCGCGHACLNNHYSKITMYIKNNPVSTPFLEMKIRPVNCKTAYIFYRSIGRFRTKVQV